MRSFGRLFPLLVTGFVLGCEASPPPVTDAASADNGNVADAGPTNDLGPVTDVPTTDIPTDTAEARCLRPLAVERVEDLGAFSLPSATVVSRDGVGSALFRGRLLWTFGDTFLRTRNPIDNTSVLSATAGWSAPATPLQLDEPVDDAGIPNQLVPYSDAELAANRTDALNGWGLWPNAAIDTGDDRLLVLFQRVKRTNGSGFETMGLGTARLAANATLAVRNPTDLFTREADGGVPSLFGSGVSVIDDTAYFFDCRTIGFLNLGCRIARVPRQRADDRAAFTFWDGSAWVADIARARIMIEHVGGSVSISRNPYLGCYLAVTGAVVQSNLVLRASPRLETGWGNVASGVTINASASGPILPPVMDAYNYLFLEHPALRSSDGRQIVVSYSRPLGNFRGEVRLIRITLR